MTTAAKYRSSVAERGFRDTETFLISDAGSETMFVFELGVELPHFALFTQLASQEGRDRLAEYMESCVKLTKSLSDAEGSVLYTPTWRASPDWAERLSMAEEEVVELNKLSVAEAMKIRERHEDVEEEEGGFRVYICGQIGPRGDGYVPGEERMSVDEAAAYHSTQIRAFAESGADLVSAATLNYAEEGAGIALAAKKLDMPAVIGFTVETDGSLPDGAKLSEAIERVDSVTGNYPVHYMINCAHPTHFSHLFRNIPPDSWKSRIGELRCNASTKSHAELDGATELDRGDPLEFGKLNGQLKKMLPSVKVWGGCCGTNLEHLEQMGVTLRTLI